MSEPKRIKMYMAKGTCLAPFFGIAYTKKEMLKRFEAFGVSERWKYKIVRVEVNEV